jgi:hypothetical protein
VSFRTIDLSVGIVILGSGLFLVGSGCTTHSEKTPGQIEQDRALADPFGYGPSPDQMNDPEETSVPTDISGGGTWNLDKKALKRDLDAVFNP